MPWWGTNIALMVGSAQSIVLDYDATAFQETLPFSFKVFDIIGQPNFPVFMVINITSAADMGTLWIDERFHLESTFQINIIGDARVLGSGGRGGAGGTWFDDNEPFPGGGTLPGVARNATNGAIGGSAIISGGFDFDLDMDDGHIYGGGGAGGGGAAYTGGFQGGGGGGGAGQGWNTFSGSQDGGNGGNGAGAGGDGSLAGPGAGGAGINLSNGDGGDGAIFGAAGGAGTRPSTPATTAGAAGPSGWSILATTSPITVTLTGAKSEATLISENRLRGPTGTNPLVTVV